METPCLVGDLGLTSLNSWESLLHLLLPRNHCCFLLPQEMGLDFCVVLALSSLASQAELLLSLVLCSQGGKFAAVQGEGEVKWSLSKWPLLRGHSGLAGMPLQKLLVRYRNHSGRNSE